MLRVLFAKFWQMMLVMFAAGFIAFALFSMAGDPVNALAGETATEEDRERIRRDLGLDKPFYVQYAHFMGRAATGEFGKSLRTSERVAELIGQRLPATLELVFVATLMTLGLGVIGGIYTGVNRKSRLSNVILSASLLGVSMPTFLLGLLGIFLFSVTLGWLPAAGRGGLVDIGLWKTSLLSLEGWRSILMPAATLAIFNIGLFIRLVRAEVIEIRTLDYIRFARARGIPERQINRVHVMPNAMPPLINVAALNIGTMIAFSLITETVFQWPGLGMMFMQAISFPDFPVMSAYFMMVALLFVILNLVADLLLMLVDPRIRRG